MTSFEIDLDQEVSLDRILFHNQSLTKPLTLEEWEQKAESMVDEDGHIPETKYNELMEWNRMGSRVFESQEFKSYRWPFQLDGHVNINVTMKSYSEVAHRYSYNKILESDGNFIYTSKVHIDQDQNFSEHRIRFYFPIGRPKVNTAEELADLLSKNYFVLDVSSDMFNSEKIVSQKREGYHNISYPVFLNILGRVGEFYSPGELDVIQQNGEPFFIVEYGQSWVPTNSKPLGSSDNPNLRQHLSINEEEVLVLPNHPNFLQDAYIKFQTVNPKLSAELQNDKMSGYDLKEMWKDGHLIGIPMGVTMLDRTKKYLSDLSNKINPTQNLAK